MPLSALRFSLLAFAVALMGASCSPYPDSSLGERLLVDREATRYGRIIAPGPDRTLTVVRGDGIAELFVRGQAGNTHGWWQIDTGAALCAISPRVARREGFQPLETGEIVTAAGTVDSQLGILASVRLGDLEVRHVTVLSLDERYLDDFQIDGRNAHVIGVLGADLLDHLGATLDFRTNTLRLRLP